MAPDADNAASLRRESFPVKLGRGSALATSSSGDAPQG
jgi:hypothetical protein